MNTEELMVCTEVTAKQWLKTIVDFMINTDNETVVFHLPLVDTATGAPDGTVIMELSIAEVIEQVTNSGLH